MPLFVDVFDGDPFFLFCRRHVISLHYDDRCLPPLHHSTRHWIKCNKYLLVFLMFISLTKKLPILRGCEEYQIFVTWEEILYVANSVAVKSVKIKGGGLICQFLPVIVSLR